MKCEIHRVKKTEKVPQKDDGVAEEMHRIFLRGLVTAVHDRYTGELK